VICESDFTFSEAVAEVVEEASGAAIATFPPVAFELKKRAHVAAASDKVIEILIKLNDQESQQAWEC